MSPSSDELITPKLHGHKQVPLNVTGHSLRWGVGEVEKYLYFGRPFGIEPNLDMF